MRRPGVVASAPGLDSEQNDKNESLNMSVPDIFRDGLARGWITYDGSRLEQDLLL